MTQMTSAYDNMSLRTINLGSGITATDAVNKSQLDTYSRAAGVGTLRALRPAVSWGQDSVTTSIQHTAFPSVVALRDGSLAMLVRRGSNHSAARDGGIWYTSSTDGGRSWAAPSQLWAASGGVEYRDPCISLSADGSKLYVTYFKASAAAPAAGCYFRTIISGVASAEVRIDGAKPYAACSAPVVELASGRLLVPFYGKDAGGDVYDSVYLAYSDNGGTSWSQTGKIYNGIGVSLDLQEPWISRKPGANDLFMTFRYGNSANIAYGTTTLTTGFSWSALTLAFAGTGRPSTVWLSTGEIIATYRDTNGQLMWTRMYSGGAWYPPTLARRTPSGGFWTYGHPIEIAPGMALCPFAEEPSGSAVSKIYLTALSRGGGSSPLGLVPPDALAVATNYDVIDYETTFKERPSGAMGPEWTTLSGALTVTSDGYLSSVTADATPDRAMVDVNNPNVTIEADFFMTVQSGVAILLRVVDASNFLMFTVETAGANARLYKVVAGVATQLATAAVSIALNSWNTLRVEVTDTLIRGYVNSTVAIGYILAAGAEASTFTSPTRHGVGLNAQSGGLHYCRRFLVLGR